MYIDGTAVKQFSSRAANPTEGWYTTAAGASPQAPFDAPFSLAISLAVGGTWPGPPDANTAFPATLSVEYVRVWGKPDYGGVAAATAEPDQAAPAPAAAAGEADQAAPAPAGSAAR